jgi:LacI family transcriptional regulator
VTNYPNFASPRPQVALLIETSNAYSRGLLRGIRTYVREGANWEIHFTEQGRGDEPPPWFHNWHGHGIVARIENSRIEEAVAATKLPVVNVSSNAVKRNFPTVASDRRRLRGCGGALAGTWLPLIWLLRRHPI